MVLQPCKVTSEGNYSVAELFHITSYHIMLFQYTYNIGARRAPECHRRRSAWIFQLGPCSEQELQDGLWLLGRHGCLRRDSEVLDLTEQVLGRGASGKVVLAKMGTGSVSSLCDDNHK